MKSSGVYLQVTTQFPHHLARPLSDPPRPKFPQFLPYDGLKQKRVTPDLGAAGTSYFLNGNIFMASLFHIGIVNIMCRRIYLILRTIIYFSHLDTIRRHSTTKGVYFNLERAWQVVYQRRNQYKIDQIRSDNIKKWTS